MCVHDVTMSVRYITPPPFSYEWLDITHHKYSVPIYRAFCGFVLIFLAQLVLVLVLQLLAQLFSNFFSRCSLLLLDLSVLLDYYFRGLNRNLLMVHWIISTLIRSFPGNNFNFNVIFLLAITRTLRRQYFLFFISL